jgi:hypothetical protein
MTAPTTSSEESHFDGHNSLVALGDEGDVVRAALNIGVGWS